MSQKMPMHVVLLIVLPNSALKREDYCSNFESFSSKSMVAHPPNPLEDPPS